MVKVLVIENENLIANKITAKLDLLKYKIISVAETKDAREALIDHNIDLCLINSRILIFSEIMLLFDQIHQEIPVPIIFMDA